MKKIVTSIIALVIIIGGPIAFANSDTKVETLSNSKSELEQTYSDLRYKTEDEILEIIYYILQEDPELYTEESWNDLMLKKNYALSLINIPVKYHVDNDEPLLLGKNDGERYYALNNFNIIKISRDEHFDSNKPYTINKGKIIFEHDFFKSLWEKEPDRENYIVQLVYEKGDLIIFSNIILDKSEFIKGGE